MRQRPNDLLQKLTEEVDRTACASDRQFFDTNPQRSHRIRHASWAEVSSLEEVDGAALPLQQGRQCFVAVKQLRPGVRLRVFFIAPAVPEGTEGPPEAAAAAWYDYVRSSQAAQIEQRLAAAFPPKRVGA